MPLVAHQFAVVVMFNNKIKLKLDLYVLKNNTKIFAILSLAVRQSILKYLAKNISRHIHQKKKPKRKSYSVYLSEACLQN